MAKPKPPRTLIPRADLIQHLHEQVSFLDWSCEGYDSGRHIESKRLASTLRVLLHDTAGGQGGSLLQHLGIKHRLSFVDTVSPGAEEFLRNNNSGFQLGLCRRKISSSGESEYDVGIPTRPNDFPRSAFAHWWERPVMIDLLRNAFSRKDLVIHLANQDGGAHVDRGLPEKYFALSRQESMGSWPTTTEVTAPDSPVPAAMRRIAEEIRLTLREQVPELSRASAHQQAKRPAFFGPAPGEA